MKDGNFVGKMFHRLLIPSVLASLGLAIGNVMDSVVVGAKMGELGLAAINISMPIYMAFNIFDIGLSLGGSITFSKLLGEGREAEAVNQFNSILQASLLMGGLFFLFGNLFLEPILFCLGTVPEQGELYRMGSGYARILLSSAPLFFLDFLLYYYIRSDNNPGLATAGFLTGSITNIVLNYIFVFFCGWGVEGAAFATVIARVSAIAVYLPHFLAKKHILRVKKIKLNISEAVASFKIGFVTSQQYLFQFVFILLMNNILMNIGRESGVAAFNVVLNTTMIAMCMGDAVNNTMQPLVSTFTGERNLESMRQVRAIALKWGLSLSVLMMFLLFWQAGNICRLFGIRGSMETGTAALRIFFTGFPAAVISSLTTGYYQSSGKAKAAFIIVFLRSFALLVPAAILFARLGLPGFWYLYAFAEWGSLLLWNIYCRVRRAELMQVGSDQEKIYSKTILSQNEDIAALVLEVESFCELRGASMKQNYFVTMAVEEICQAIMQHAFGSRGQGYIQITLIADGGGEFELHIRDSAVAFNPFEMKTGKIRLGVEDQDSLDAMGILMVKTKAKEFFYRSYQGFNTLTIRI